MDSQYSEQNFEEGIVFPRRGDRQSWGGGTGGGGGGGSGAVASAGGTGADGGVIFQAEKPRDFLKKQIKLGFSLSQTFRKNQGIKLKGKQG